MMRRMFLAALAVCAVGVPVAFSAAHEPPTQLPPSPPVLPTPPPLPPPSPAPIPSPPPIPSIHVDAGY